MTGRIKCRNISPYLLPDSQTVVCPVKTSLFGLKQMLLGSMAKDGGFLTFKTDSEKEEFCSREPLATPYVKKMIGTDEILAGSKRWCLWLVDAPKEILELPLVAERVKARRVFLLKSEVKSQQIYAKNGAHLFRQIVQPKECLAILRFFPDNRTNIIAVKMNEDTVVTDSCYLIRNADCIDFSILSSRMHSIWTRFVCGRHATNVRYSIDLCWNTFPFPKMFDDAKRRLKDASSKILRIRNGCEMTLADMYRSDIMPEALKIAHQKLDSLVDRLYNPDGFDSDRERLECLLRMYEEKTSRKPADIDQWC